MNDWCILRTSGRNTMTLAASLAEDGYEVWTPIETRTIRIPRANVRREVRLPIMPSYVFAKAHQLVDLLELAAMPVKPRRGARRMQPAHVRFSVLHVFDRIPLVADQHFTELRRIEAKRTPLKKAEKAFPMGAKVKVDGGSFGGLRGVVERSDRTHTVVCFNDRYVIKIPTSLLNADDIKTQCPLEDEAAREAA